MLPTIGAHLGAGAGPGARDACLPARALAFPPWAPTRHRPPLRGPQAPRGAGPPHLPPGQGLRGSGAPAARPDLPQRRAARRDGLGRVLNSSLCRRCRRPACPPARSVRSSPARRASASQPSLARAALLCRRLALPPCGLLSAAASAAYPQCSGPAGAGAGVWGAARLSRGARAPPAGPAGKGHRAAGGGGDSQRPDRAPSAGGCTAGASERGAGRLGGRQVCEGAGAGDGAPYPGGEAWRGERAVVPIRSNTEGSEVGGEI